MIMTLSAFEWMINWTTNELYTITPHSRYLWNLGTKNEARGLRISWIPPMWHIAISYWYRHKSAFMVIIFFFTEREGRRWGCVCRVSRCFHTQWLCQDLTLQVGCPFLCTMTLSWPYECIVSNNDLYSVCMFSSFQRLVNLQRLVYF